MSILQGIPAALGTGWNSTSATLDATTDQIAFRFRARTTAPIVKVEILPTVETGAPGNFGVVLCANTAAAIPTISGGVPTDIGGGSPTLVTVAANGITVNTPYVATLTNPYTPTAGQDLWLVVYPIDGTWDGSNLLTLRIRYLVAGASTGDEMSSVSADTGSTWTTSAIGDDIKCFSLLTTGDAYIPLTSSVCAVSVTGPTAFDDADTPDERGCAWDVPASTSHSIYGAYSLQTTSSTTSDFTLAAYEGTTQLGTRTVDVSALAAAAQSLRAAALNFDAASYTAAAGTVGRITRRPTSGTETISSYTLNCGTQARRESCLMLAGTWYCYRDGGSGAFTDEKDKWTPIVPILGAAGTAGGSTNPFTSLYA